MRLIDYAHDILVKRTFTNAKRLPNVFYPTEASAVLFDTDGKTRMFGKCARAVFMRMMNMPEAKSEERAERIFSFGKFFEQNEIDVYKRAGIYEANNVKFSMQIPNTNYFVSGEVDAIVKEPNGKYLGVEFKTSYGANFIRQNITGYKRKGKATGLDYVLDEMMPAPKLEHLMQVMMYLDFYRDYEPKIEEFRMVYGARDSMDMAEYSVQLVEKANGKRYAEIYKLDSDIGNRVPIIDISTQDIYDRYIYIGHAIDKQSAPMADYDVLGGTDWQCAYCEYRDACKLFATIDSLKKKPDANVAVK